MTIWIWDPEKDSKNREKHKLPLETGRFVLDGDPLALSVPDPHPDGDRWRTIGKIRGITTLFVVHTEPVEDEEDGEEYGRIISVRKATVHERKAYENGL